MCVYACMRTHRLDYGMIMSCDVGFIGKSYIGDSKLQVGERSSGSGVAACERPWLSGNL